MSDVRVTIQPILDATSDNWMGESDTPFSVKVVYGAGDEQEVTSLHDGLIHFVTVDVPPWARVEVQA